MAARVLVTGASGFIAQHVILALLDKGYEVRGTVRSAAKGEALRETLSARSTQTARIEIVEADLSSDGGWVGAVGDCEYVQHVASPIPAVLPRDHDELIIPARDGALRVLRAAKAGGVTRVVMTSSMAAIAYGWGDQRPDPLTEEHWSNPDDLTDNTAYTRSKTIAERAAWDYVNGDGAGLELATINPSLVLGPLLSDKAATSVEAVTQLLGGKLPLAPKIGFQIVDVRDVAAAHVAAMELPEAAGERFGVTEDFLWFGDVADILRDEFPAYAKKLPKATMPSFALRLLSIFNPVLKQVVPELGKRRFLSNEKAKRVLGWTPRPARDSFISCAKSVIEHGVV